MDKEIITMVVLTAEEMLHGGLRHLGVTPDEWHHRKARTNEEDFAAHCGPMPEVAADSWAHLQTTNVQEARINPQKHFVKDFLTALHWLRTCPTERERQISIEVGKNSGQKWSWFCTQRIALFGLNNGTQFLQSQLTVSTCDARNPQARNIDSSKDASLTSMEAPGLIVRLACASSPKELCGWQDRFLPEEVILTSFATKDQWI